MQLGTWPIGLVAFAAVHRRRGRARPCASGGLGSPKGRGPERKTTPANALLLVPALRARKKGAGGRPPSKQNKDRAGARGPDHSQQVDEAASTAEGNWMDGLDKGPWDRPREKGQRSQCSLAATAQVSKTIQGRHRIGALSPLGRRVLMRRRGLPAARYLGHDVEQTGKIRAMIRAAPVFLLGGLRQGAFGFGGSIGLGRNRSIRTRATHGALFIVLPRSVAMRDSEGGLNGSTKRGLS